MSLRHTKALSEQDKNDHERAQPGFSPATGSHVRPQHSFTRKAPGQTPSSFRNLIRRKAGSVFGWTISQVQPVCRAVAERIAYQITLLLEASLWMKLFVLWLFSASLVAVGASMLVASKACKDWGAAFFHSYALLHNAPGTSAWEYSGAGLFLANALFITGLLTFAVTIGTVSSYINAVLEEVWKADHTVLESDHIVVINWNHMIVPILRQLMAGFQDGQKKSNIVLLAQEDTTMMRNVIKHEIGPMVRNIIVRGGNPSSIRDLAKISVGTAKRILLLSPDSCIDVSSHGSVKSMLTTQIAVIKSLQQLQLHAIQHGPLFPACVRVGFHVHLFKL